MKTQVRFFTFKPHILVAGAAWASKIVTAVGQVIIMRYLITYLGVNDYSTFAVLASLAGWLALSDCGFGTAFQNTISIYRAQKTPHENLLVQARLIQFILVMFWIPLLILISFPASWYFFPNAHITASKLIIIVIISNLLWMCNAVASIAYKILYSMQLGVLANIYPAIGSIISLCAIIQLTMYDFGKEKLLIAIIAYVTPMTLSAILANVHLKTSYIFCYDKRFWSNVYAVSACALRFFGFSLLVSGVTGLDYLIMSQILQPINIATYTVISKVFTFVYFLYYSILTAMWPIVTELMTLNNYKEVKRHVINALAIGLLIIIIFTGLFIYFKNVIISILTGGKISISTQSIVFFGGYYLLRVWGDAFAVVIASINKVRIFYIFMPFQAVISAGGQYILGQRYGIDGIILGTAISFALTAVWINPLSVFRIIRQKSISTFIFE